MIEMENNKEIMEYRILKVKDLHEFAIRDIRQNTVDKLKESIEKNGYDFARPLKVVLQDRKYFVADGNHRLKSIPENITELPCLICNDDIYSLAVKSNSMEDVYSKMDLFDWLDIIEKMKDEGYKQNEIKNILKCSQDYIQRISTLSLKMTDEILKKFKDIERGFVKLKVDAVSFSEYWFRESGLYKLNNEYQEYFYNEIINDKVNINNKKMIKNLSAKLMLWQDLIEIAKEKLVNEDDFKSLVDLIENDNFKNEGQLLSKINDLNKESANKLICGDCLIELEKLEDCSIDLVITDPPYGIDYSSNRSKDNNHITKNKIMNDKEEAFELLDKACEILKRKTKPDSHFYFFTSWKVYSKFEEIISRYFDIRNMIVWDKGNHGSGDLENTWGNKHELIIFATKGNRKLNKRKSDVISVNKISSNNLIHPTQKPVKLITELLEVSSQKADTVCDPFMGSGSIIKAIKDFGDLNYVGIELDNNYFEKAKIFIGG